MSTAPPALSLPGFNPQTTTFGKRVLYTGFAHAKAGLPLDVMIQDLTFRFTFVDSGNPTASISAKLLNPKLLELQCLDFVSPVGIGVIEPYPLGQFGGVQTYLLFTVYAVANSAVKLVFCTFLQDEMTKTALSSVVPRATVPGPT